ncbi:acyltransferase family protein [Edaphobacter bradus]|uniref:acyltransferase family protein n=1 Tax=Edaphobacter bradus TaxID=2259016 RepID=UPI0021E05CCF|nr:acyltransferase [Edaphobacter bradus]
MSVASLPKTAARFADSRASVLFDLIRGLAALVVLFEHSRNLFFIDYHQITQHRGLLALPYLLSGAGHQAVVVFFLLSGYFISGAVFRALDRNQWQWSDYLLRRFLRLWVVLVPALLLCLFWDKLGIRLGHAPALYSGAVQNHMIGDVRHLLAPHIFFGNLFFVQVVLTPVFGSDGALWSLAYEFWYYILFPLGILALRRRTQRLYRVVCAVLFVATAWFVRGGILLSFPIWLAGALLYKLPAPRLSAGAGYWLRIAAAAIYLPAFFGLAKIHTFPSLLNDYILAILTFGLLWLLLSANDCYTPGSPGERASRNLARFSYTLYAVHTPLLVFLASLLIGDTRWTPSLRTVALFIGILLATVGYAYLLAYFTEFRTDTLRLRLERLFGMPTSRPALPSAPVTEAIAAREMASQ